MLTPVVKSINWLQRRADNVAVALLSAMFSVFILQVFFRYVVNNPLGWTLEACLLCWLVLVFWGGAFSVKDKDHVRFDIFYNAAPRKLRILFSLISALAIVVALAVSFPATFDFVAFMKIESTSLLKIRFDILFSIYLLFSIIVILRYGKRIVLILTGKFIAEPQLHQNPESRSDEPKHGIGDDR